MMLKTADSQNEKLNLQRHIPLVVGLLILAFGLPISSKYFPAWLELKPLVFLVVNFLLFFLFSPVPDSKQRKLTFIDVVFIAFLIWQLAS